MQRVIFKLGVLSFDEFDSKLFGFVLALFVRLVFLRDLLLWGEEDVDSRSKKEQAWNSAFYLREDDYSNNENQNVNVDDLHLNYLCLSGASAY